MLKKFSGSGAMFGGSAPKETDDNLFSTDIVEVVLGVSEGPIKGLKDGPKSFLIGDTPLENQNGDDNFDSFELVVRRGSDLGEKIVSRMGGFASSTNVGTELASQVPVTRQATHTSIDYVDIRLVINRLMRSNDKGTFDHTGRVKIEYKKTNEANWHHVVMAGGKPPPQEQSSGFVTIFSRLTKVNKVSPTPGDRPVYRQIDVPAVAAGQEGALWFDSNDNNRPYRLDGGSYTAISGASFSNNVWTWTENSAWGSNKLTRFYVTTQYPQAREQGDYWLDSGSNQIMLFNGSSWIFAGTSLVPGNFGNAPITINFGEANITGKTTTSTVIEFRFPVDNIPDDTYQFRVTKMNPNNTSEDFFDVVWESFQEVTAQPMQFPGLATVQATARASEQFSSIPQFSGIYEGREIRVPTNYDPVAHTFSGMWDGTWKIAYTTNPAFIVNDLVSNDRYGLNAYYPVVLNKWDVYEAGVWCDTRTKNGVPRFTFNLLLDTPRNCREAIDFICGIFGGRFFDDGNGSANIRIDRPSNAAGIFAKENILDGIFSYSFTDTTSRYNDITVTFKNPDLQYREDRVRVYDQNHIDKYGRIPLNFIAVGCNSREEAIIRGRYKLATGLGETTIVNFKTNRQGLYYVPYDIILVADEDMNSGITGRVKEVTGSKTFSLRDPVSLEAGINYKVIFQIPDGTDVNNFLVVEREIPAGTNGVLNSITTVANLPALPENAVFMISTTDDAAAPRPYRITRIDEMEGDPDKVEIQAIEVNRLKWDFVDGIIDEVDPPIRYDLGTGGRPAPVPIVRLRAFNTFNGPDQVHNLLLDWDPSPSKTVSLYRVYVSKDNGPAALLAETRTYSFEYNNILPGEYLFTIIAVSPVSGAMSDSVPTTIEHRFIGDLKDPTRVTDLHLVDEALPFVYARRSPTFAWTAVTEPSHRDYVIRISDAQSGLLMAQHYTREAQFTYAYETNRADHSGVAVRAFTIGLASRDQYGNLSSFNSITVNNPPPAALTPEISSGVNAAVIQWNTTGITDYLGAKIWISTDPAVPMNSMTLEYEGGGNNYTYVGFPQTVYYMRIALVDNFNPTEYVVSNPVMFTVETIDLGDIQDIFDGPIGYISDDSGSGLAANLRSLEERLNENSIIVARQGIAEWAQRDTLKRNIERQGAKFSEEINVLQTEDLAIVNRLTEFEADMSSDLQTVNARITTEETARANEDDAISSTLNTLIATVGSNNSTITARVQTEEQARASADEGLASTITSVSTVANNAAAAVVTEATARTNSDSALSTRVDEVAASYNGFSASGRAAFQVSATPSGATARYSVVVRANTNNVFAESGLFFDIMSNGSTRASIKANSFSILNDAGGYLTSPFYIENGIVYMNNALIKGLTADKINVSSLEALSANLGNVSVHGVLLINGTVYTDKVAGEAITVVGATGSGGWVTTTANRVTLSEIYVPGDGTEKITITTSVICRASSGYPWAEVYLERDGVTVASAAVREDDIPSSAATLVFTQYWPGNHVWRLTGANVSGAGTAGFQNAFIMYIKGKR